MTRPPASQPSAAAIGLVAIGRNEGRRLEACLDAALAQLPPERVVYVDSGSTDGSVAAARARGVAAVALDPADGFTAARARNAGAAHLLEGADPPAFVQFVDGDCRLAPGWLGTAHAAMEADPRLAAAAGRRREVAPEASPWNRLCDMEWNTPVGEAAAVGGDALYRAAALRAAGGFDGAMICGEEPELCFRLRRLGWRIRRLDAEMTRHDAAMTRAAQWARRTVRTGWAFAEGAARMGGSAEGYNRRERARILGWGGVLPAAVLGLLLLALLGTALGGLRGWALLAALAGLAGLAAYPLMALRVAARRRAARGDPWPHALLYGAAVMAGKPFEMAGLMRYRTAARRGARGRIIEYKS